jgi:hypothetical protein
MIYFIQAGGPSGAIKIGYTARDPQARLADLQTGCPHLLALLGSAPGTMVEERKIHERFTSLRLQGEWFSATLELLAFVDGVQWAGRNVPLPDPEPERPPGLFGLTFQQADAIRGYIEAQRALFRGERFVERIGRKQGPLTTADRDEADELRCDIGVFACADERCSAWEQGGHEIGSRYGRDMKTLWAAVEAIYDRAEAECGPAEIVDVVGPLI